MKDGRWQEIERLYNSALERKPEERAAYLGEACRDESLRKEVESLLACHSEAKAFIETPALEAAVQDLAHKQSNQASAALSGRTLSHYRILEKLGEGGMGVVYKAFDTRLTRPVALKVLPPDRVTDPERKQRFVKEARAASALNHPNIVTIYDIGQAEGVDFIAMEYTAGKTLDRRIGRKGLPVGETLKYGAQIADALAAAHAAGIVHRDLKPSNIMVSDKGLVKVLDFGLAKLTERPPSDESGTQSTSMPLTDDGRVMGTAPYMSPEQAEGKPVDARSDIFSFGSVLYEMATGRRAFRGDSIVSTLSAIVTGEPEPVGGEVPHNLKKLILHCLRKDPARRMQYVDDIKIALDDLKEESDLGRAAAAVGKIADRGGAAVKRWKWIVSAGVVAAILAIAGFWYFVSRTVVAPVQPKAVIGPSIAVLPFTNLGDDKGQEYFSDGLADELIGMLGKVKELRVAGRTSSFAFKGKTGDLRTIGEKLAVGAILEGSVRRSGEQLRVSTQLVNVADGYQMWAETYDRKMADVFAVQDEIAGAVVAALKVKLLPHERPVVSQHRTSNTEAYNQYLLGRQFWNWQSTDGYRGAADAYQKAIALDPNFAAAYAGVALSVMGLVDLAGSRAEQVEAQRKALSMAEKAVSLDPELGEAYAARGNIRSFIGFDWPGAQGDFERALSLNPGDPITHAGYGRFLARLGRLPEAIAECRKATELDPLFVRGWTWEGMYLYGSGHLAEARRVLTRALEISPDNGWARFFMGVTLILGGDPKAALTGIDPPNTPLRLCILALAQHDMGNARESQRALDTLIDKYGKTSAYRIAEVYAWRGERDPAFEWIDRAYEQGNTQLPTLIFDPLVAKLRGDPRYQAMLTKLNLPTGK